MKSRREFARGRIAAGITTVALLGCVGVAVGQGTGDSTGGGSLEGVTAELRQLRIAIEESTRTQAQTHAIGVYVSAQQGRVAQATTRLDTARRELETATNRSRELMADLAQDEDAADRATRPELKTQLQLQMRALKANLESAGVQLQQAQTRYSEAAQSAQFEEHRWNELVAKLEAAIKK
jgi:uncharacterized membrane-anchored protein YhcB (DUF1043 family)